MILLIAYEKGGTGKSTLAKNLSVYLQHKGRDLITVDTDPQETLYRWSEVRKSNPDAKPINCVKLTGRHILSELKSLSTKYQDLVIDAGGADSPALRAAMSIATHLLVPLQANVGDLEILDHMADVVEQAQLINPNLYTRAVMTMCPALPSMAGAILDAKEFCKMKNIQPLNAIIYRRQSYDLSSLNGLTALESSDQKARQEVMDLANEFLEV